MRSSRFGRICTVQFKRLPKYALFSLKGCQFGQLNLGVGIAKNVAKGFVQGEVFKVWMNLQLFTLSI